MIDMHQSGPNTRKVFHKLLMSFRMQKKLLGAYLGGGGWGGWGGCWEGLQSDLEN